MKKKAMMLAVLAMAAVAVQAENTTQKNQVVTTSIKTVEAVSVKLSSDEQAFSAKLNDQNRASFSQKLSEEQRQAAMVAAKNGANADEAVTHLVAAQELKAASVVDATEANAETEAAK